MPRRCRTRTRASTSCCPPSASCSRPTMSARPSELLRVCKPGGRIGLASWTPSGFLGKLFRVVGRYVPPIPGVRSPLLWGTDAHLRELFACGDEDRAYDPDVRVPLSIARALGRRVPDLLWARPQSVSRLGRGPPVPTRSRSHRAPSLAEPRRRSGPRGPGEYLETVITK